MATGGASGRERGAPPRFTVEIERLAAGGEGVGRVGGKAVFVPGAAPGDLLEAVVVREWRTVVRGRALRLLRPSPVRVAPPCPAFGACGGCCWQHPAPAAQLEAKRGIVGVALRRICRIAALPPPLPPDGV